MGQARHQQDAILKLIRNIRDKLTARHKSGVVFIHAQKCGGSSLEAALFRHYRFSKEHIFPIEARYALRAIYENRDAHLPETEALVFREELTAYALERGVKCVAGHIPISPSLRRHYAQTHKFITILREPVSRFCSNVRFSYNSGLETSIGADIDAFLESPRAPYYGALYATIFGGVRDIGETITQSNIDLAREQILGLDAVGFLDNLAAFEKNVCRILSANIAIGFENKTTDRKTAWQGEFTDKQMDKIRSLCRPNIDIYEYVREKLAA